MAQTNWTSQYGQDFRFHRGSNRAPRRVVSPKRKNNPHPIKDFLIYNRLPVPKESLLRDKIYVHLERKSKSAAVPRTLRCPPPGYPKKTAHWIEWPKSPSVQRPHTSLGVHDHDHHTSALQLEKTSLEVPSMTARPPSYIEQAIARSLSPRRHAQAPGMPGRSYTHYNGYAIPVSSLGALDLQAPNFSYATGQQYAIPNYTVYGPPPRESRPMHRHKSRRDSDKDYVHNHSVFTSTIPAVTGYYIIHPDWVSERSSLRRANSMMALKS